MTALKKGKDKQDLPITLSILSYFFSGLALFKTLQANSDWWEPPLLLAVGMGVGLIKEGRTLMLNSRRVQVIDRDRLVDDMQFITPFEVTDWYSPIRQFVWGHEAMTRDEKSELEQVRRMVAREQFRARYNHAIEDRNEAMWNAYRSGEFHKAMAFATKEWLEVILLVARSRYDSRAIEIVKKYDRYWA